MLYNIAIVCSRHRIPMASPAKLYPQDVVLKNSLSDPISFWGAEARKLTWAKTPSAILGETPLKAGARNWEWFPGGEISTTYNCLTRHVEAGYGEQTAIIWDSPVTETYNKRISYAQLLKDVQIFAGVLRGLGVKKGDRVLIYSTLLYMIHSGSNALTQEIVPMIPAALIAMYATSHLGAIHSVVFGGFAPAECAKRIASCQPEVIVTASCGIEGGIDKRRIIPYLPLVREAVKLSGNSGNGPKIVVWQRPLHLESLENGEKSWQTMVDKVQQRWGLTIDRKNETIDIEHRQDKKSLDVITSHSSNPEDDWAPVMDGVPVASNDPLYIIYTSGMALFTQTPI